MKEQRGPWYILTGAIIGLALGLLIAWVIIPVQAETTPATLRKDFKDQYRYMIAVVYSTTGNLERARARLALIEDTDPAKALGEQAQRMLANNASMDSVRPLADLGEAIQVKPTLTALPSPSEAIVVTETIATNSPLPASPFPKATVRSTASTVTPGSSATSGPIVIPTLKDTLTPLSTPIFTAVSRSTRTPTPTPGAPFELTNQSAFCEPTQPGLLKVYIENASGKPAAGIELVITWLGSEEHFFTGLKPELGYGYADFVMSPNVEYALSLSSGGTRVTGLMTSACTAADSDTYPGGIRLEFKQP